MAEGNEEITYNVEEDILNLSRKKSSQASIEIGDFILDIDFNGFVSAIEILNASENLGLDKNILSNLDKAKMGIVYKPGYIFVMLVFNSKDIEKDIRIPLTLDLGHKQIEKQEVVFVK